MQVSRALFLAAGLTIAAPTAQAAVLISIDKSAQRMSVSVNGSERWTWPVSTGRGNYATPSGSFKPFRMEASHFSKEWDDAPMPHSIFFTKVGHAIHGTYDAAHLGSPVSHGCVRVSAANATQLYNLVKAEGVSNTKVVITGQQPYGEPEAYNRQNGGQGFFGQSNQNWFGQNSYNQSSYNQNFYNQNSQGRNAYDRNTYQNSYGQNSHGQSSYQTVSSKRGKPQSNEQRGNWFPMSDPRY
jgi:L,D-transpeptidase-like protein